MSPTTMEIDENSTAYNGQTRSAVRAGAPVLAGVNCRDLRDLQVRFERFAELAPFLPRHLAVVAESGIASSADIEAVAAANYRLALIGSALMRSADAARTLGEWVAAGRATLGSLRPCS